MVGTHAVVRNLLHVFSFLGGGVRGRSLLYFHTFSGQMLFLLLEMTDFLVGILHILYLCKHNIVPSITLRAIILI